MKILFATDGSRDALAGARLLASLPLESDSRIHILTVLREGHPDTEGEPALRSAQDILCGTQAGIATEIRHGNAEELILHTAEKQGDDLIVIGRRGMSAAARFFIGGTAERVARHAPCPVLLARPLHGVLDRVMLGVDGSDCSRQAAEWLLRFPLPPACDIRLITVTPPREAISALQIPEVPLAYDELIYLAEQDRERATAQLAALEKAARETNRQVYSEVWTDHPAHGLLTAAEEQEVDLLVVGSRGLTGLDRFLMGSVSEKTMHYAHCSVLVVRGA